MWSGGQELESWVGAGPRSLGVSPAPHHRLRRLIPCSLPIGTSSPRKDLESQPQPAVWAPTPHLFSLGKPRRATGFPTLAKRSKPQVRSPHRLQGAAGTQLSFFPSTGLQGMWGSERTASPCFIQGSEESSASAPQTRSESSLVRSHCTDGSGAPPAPGGF